jgi:hypothetical protein
MVPPTLLKQFAAGHGQADKHEMVSLAKKESKVLQELPSNICTNDVCDAYFLAKFTWYKKDPESVVKNEVCKDRLRHRIEISKGGF